MPSRDPLVALSDIQARVTVTLTAGQQAAASALITDASARVRNWTRQDFAVGSRQDTVNVRPTDGKIRLRLLPVLSVDEVARVLPDGTESIAYGLWIYDGIDTINVWPPAPLLVNAPVAWTSADWWWRDVAYAITYTHGYAAVPDDVISVVCGMVSRVLLAPGAPGVIGETITNYSYRMADGVMPGQTTLTAADKEQLEIYRRPLRTLELR
jgi:hypothetical protein